MSSLSANAGTVRSAVIAVPLQFHITVSPRFDAAGFYQTPVPVRAAAPGPEWHGTAGRAEIFASQNPAVARSRCRRQPAQ